MNTEVKKENKDPKLVEGKEKSGKDKNQTSSLSSPNTSEGEKSNKKDTPSKPKKRKYVRKGGKKGRRKKQGRGRSEYDQKILNIRRVTRVVAGGRRFSFSVAMAIGDKKGSVGVGLGKAGDTSLAIEKALRDAKKNLVKPNLTKDMSIPHDVRAKYTSSEVIMAPKKGGGLKAGSSVRTVLELLGATDISAKVLSRSKNKINNARAAIKALEKLGKTADKSVKKKEENNKGKKKENVVK